MTTHDLPVFGDADHQNRSAWQVTLSVWTALFLREACHRLAGGRAAWFWLLLEPISHTVYLMILFSALHQNLVPGVHQIALFIALGVYGFQTFKFAASRSIGAIDANAALFAYRQVKPVDTSLARSALEGMLQLIAQVALMVMAALVGVNIVPTDPLLALEAIGLLWLLGAGLGLVLSAASELIPEIGRMATVIFTFFYAFSGVMFLPESASPAYRKWLLLNPVIHGVEPLRHAFFPYYRMLPEISLGYLAACAVGTVFLGLALHVGFRDRLRAL